jgi:midasin (ATPase involved in ribosome maturation)
MEDLNRNVVHIRTAISNSHTKTYKYTNIKIIFFCEQSAITPTFFDLSLMSSNCLRKIIKEYIRICNLFSNTYML